MQLFTEKSSLVHPSVSLRHRSQTWRQRFSRASCYRSCTFINNHFLNRFWNFKLTCTVAARERFSVVMASNGSSRSVFTNFRPLILNGMSLFKRIFHPLDNQFYIQSTLKFPFTFAFFWLIWRIIFWLATNFCATCVQKHLIPLLVTGKTLQVFVFNYPAKRFLIQELLHNLHVYYSLLGY